MINRSDSVSEADKNVALILYMLGPSATANTYPLSIPKKPVYMYDVLIQLVVPPDNKLVQVNKEQSSNVDKHYFHKMVTIAKAKSAILRKIDFAYDGGSIFYAPTKISTVQVVLQSGDLPANIRSVFRHPVDIIIQPTNKPEIKSPFDMNDLNIQVAEQVLATIVAQHSYDCGHYFNLGNGFQYSLETLGKPTDGIELRRGITKSFNEIGDNKQIGLEIDFRISAFYPAQSISQYLEQLRENRDKVSKFLKGVKVSPSYSQYRTFLFDSILPTTAGQCTFDLNGTTISVAQYYKKKFNINVQASCPLVSVKPKTAGCFPANLLVVQAFQKIKNERIADIQAVHKHNVVSPATRRSEIKQAVDHLILTRDNPVLNAFGITVSMAFQADNGISTKIYRPSVFAGGKKLLTDNKANFLCKDAKYALSAAISKWAVLYSQEIPFNVIQGGIGTLTRRAGEKGLHLPSPAVVQSVNPDSFMEGVFKTDFPKFKASGIQYVLYVENKMKHAGSHNAIKLVEPRYKIVIQQLDGRTMNAIASGRSASTMDNVINKLNMKMGGLNFVPDIDVDALSLNKGVFVIAYQVAHGKVEKVEQDPVTKKITRHYSPAVVGFSGNYSHHAHLFIGTYFYQAEKGEATEGVDDLILTNQVRDALRLIGHRRPEHCRPKTIVVLRDGISRYAYADFADREIRAIKKGCDAAFTDGTNYKPKIVGIVVTQRSTTRVFVPSADMSKPPPGTIIDTAIIKPKSEFVIIPQNALKGTAKPVKAVVVHNETSIPIENMAKFLSALCYSHQLTNGATGLPEPVYQSGILARRGAYILTAFRDYFSENMPKNANEPENFARSLTNMLSTRGSPLELIRYTA